MCWITGLTRCHRELQVNSSLEATVWLKVILNQPELTAAKFIPNPFDPSSGARLYRTGDQVKFLPDGSLQFQGRLDYQVKIRGHRVELGEIESILAKCPACNRQLSLCERTQEDNRMLVGYFVPDLGKQVSTKEFREFLENKLPDYSVPSCFVPLERFPLTPSGKVDRKALPAPASRRPEVNGTVAAPNTSTEESLARIWCEVLELPTVGIHDNFFELGGHSLGMDPSDFARAAGFPDRDSFCAGFPIANDRKIGSSNRCLASEWSERPHNVKTRKADNKI
jgi:hypothetical protein